MTHQYLVTFANGGDLGAARETLGAMRLSDGRALFDFNARTEGGLYFSCNISTPVAADALVEREGAAPKRFGDILYKIDATKSGRHHPDGALWFATGEQRAVRDPVSILDVFPTMLDLLGIDRGGLEDRPGRSLMKVLRP